MSVAPQVPPVAGAPSQRTALNAVLAGGLLVLLVALLAHACSGRWTTEAAMERYVKLGPRAGAAELERDLLRDHPPGSDLGALFARLSRLGFDCRIAVDPEAAGECRFRSPHGERRLATISVAVRQEEMRVGTVAVRMAVSAP